MQCSRFVDVQGLMPMDIVGENDPRMMRAWMEPLISAGSIDLDASKPGSVVAISNEPDRAETRPVSHVTPQILVVPLDSRHCKLTVAQ